MTSSLSVALQELVSCFHLSKQNGTSFTDLDSNDHKFLLLSKK